MENLLKCLLDCHPDFMQPNKDDSKLTKSQKKNLIEEKES